jgi:tetratricopeptide (TPR) repeat protein
MKRTAWILGVAAALALAAAVSLRVLPRPYAPPPETTVRTAAAVDPLPVLREHASGGEPLALLELALLEQRAGDAGASVRTLERLVREHPSFARGRHYLGVAYLALQRPAEARREFAAEVRLAPGDAEALVDVGMALQALGDRQGAHAAFLRAQQRSPDSPTPYFALAQLDRGPAGYPEALANIERFIQRSARPAPGYHLMSQIYAHKGERDRALTYAQRAIEEDPANAQFWHQLGRVYHGMSGPESLPRALRCYREALRLGSGQASVWFDLGRAYAAAHAWDDAAQALEKAKRGDPGNVEVHYHLSNALRTLGRTSEAARELAAYRTLREQARRKPNRAPVEMVNARVAEARR